LPGLKEYLKRKGTLPEGLVLGLAAIMVYYRGGKRADGVEIIPNDAPEIMALLSQLWSEGSVENLVERVLGTTSIWGEDLNSIPLLAERVAYYIDKIQNQGMLQTVKELVG
jgi:tagaturonate reductase